MSELLKRNNNTIDKILGNSIAIRQVKSLIHQVAPSDITILITGESGTGKELVASALHDLSHRRSGPLMTLNCGAIPEGIFESEIFGHEKGSFTSADQRRKGYFEMANRGTLFLDEIGEMPMTVQVKILRVLETGSFIRVGGSNEIKVDVRVIAATNKELGNEVERGRFRQDLYYRLKAVSIRIPPLRERVDDIPILANHFILEFSRRNKRPEPMFDAEALDMLRRHYWTGNIRELKNFVESLVALSSSRRLSTDLVSSQLGSDLHSSNLPVLLSRPSEEADRDLIYRTLLELRHELNVIKGLLQQQLQKDEREIGYPFTTAEEVETYAYDEVDKKEVQNNTLSNEVNVGSAQQHLSLNDLEREQIQQTLSRFKGNRRLTANALGIGERTLYRKIKMYDLK